jgi:hypothetical protein
MIRFVLLGIAALAAGAGAAARPPLYQDPVRLNIGYLCRWQVPCIERQQTAMYKALSYVKRKDPPNWKVQQCNRNAARGRSRVDWIGYYNCIRNSKLRSFRRSVPR